MIFKILSALVLILLAAPNLPSAHADWKDNLRRHSRKVQLAQLPENSQVIASSRSGWFDQKIDHANPADPRTFRQRYFVNTALAQGPAAPVLYYICGEGPCNAHDFAGEALEMARRYHAILVALEHRYYGASQPFNDLSVEHLRFLSVDQALADLANFQDYARARLGFTGKWISMGGSYPGALSAFYRMRFPDHVVGALASSAPVEARIAFEDFDRSVFIGAGPQCAAALQSVTRTIDDGLRDPVRARALFALFDVPELHDPRDLLYIVADLAAMTVQYGFKDELCKTLLSPSADPVAAYAELTKKTFARMGSHPLDDAFESLLSIDLWSNVNRVGGRQWFYQSCTEWGFFQVAARDAARSARSPRIDLPFHLQMCQRAFGNVRPADERAMNSRFYHPLQDPRTSRILFTNGSEDPWSTLSITRERRNDINPNLMSFMLPGMSHCSDLGSLPAPPVQQAHELFARLIAEWL